VNMAQAAILDHSIPHIYVIIYIGATSYRVLWEVSIIQARRVSVKGTLRLSGYLLRELIGDSKQSMDCQDRIARG